ncbi:immunity protein PlnM [Lactiplantibacillus plantarum]|nr:immunity protein PlnM [Lactiplantibacillus plantarum]KZT89075.1 immunity protein PlnM [Lactiplantibacillus plantarum]
MLERITEFIIICFAILQIYTAYLAFKQVKQVGNKSASPFIALGV